MHIAIAHSLLGLTDGASLEIAKRKQILEKMGHTVFTIAGYHIGPADLTIPALNYKYNPRIQKIQMTAFKEHVDCDAIQKEINEVADETTKQLEEFYSLHSFSHLFVHNVFSLPTTLAASLGFFNFIKAHPELHVIAVNHDFYHEPPWEGLYISNCEYIQKLLLKLFPADLPNITHVTINSLAQKFFIKHAPIVISDTFDFDQALWSKNEKNQAFLKDVGLNESDIIFLSAVRIRKRKGLELALDVLAELNKIKSSMIGKKKYSGEAITSESKIVLLFAGNYTPNQQDYLNQLTKKAAELHVDIRFINNLVGSEEEKVAGIKKYSLWDCYVFADMVMYPSLWEGWGNQFIEAIFAKKPIIVFEYPVFKQDIKSKGFDVISLGSEYKLDENNLAVVDKSTLEKVAKEATEILTSYDLYKVTIEKNFEIGKKYYNIHTVLQNHLETILQIALPSKPISITVEK